MRAFAALFKNELKLNIRDMNMVIFAVIMPIIVLIILGIIYGTSPASAGSSYTFIEQSFGALCTISICAGGLAKNSKSASVIASVLYFPMLINFPFNTGNSAHEIGFPRHSGRKSVAVYRRHAHRHCSLHRNCSQILQVGIAVSHEPINLQPPSFE